MLQNFSNMAQTNMHRGEPRLGKGKVDEWSKLADCKSVKVFFGRMNGGSTDSDFQIERYIEPVGGIYLPKLH